MLTTTPHDTAIAPSSYINRLPMHTDTTDTLHDMLPATPLTLLAIATATLSTTYTLTQPAMHTTTRTHMQDVHCPTTTATHTQHSAALLATALLPHLYSLMHFVHDVFATHTLTATLMLLTVILTHFCSRDYVIPRKRTLTATHSSLATKVSPTEGYKIPTFWLFSVSLYLLFALRVIAAYAVSDSIDVIPCLMFLAALAIVLARNVIYDLLT